MSLAVTAPPSPYKGLAPFEDSDADALLFFGRERESEIIAANLIASRITVLYGPSGVGKSSLLRAGVAHRLRREQEAEVIVFSTWTGDPVAALVEAARERGGTSQTRSQMPPIAPAAICTSSSTSSRSFSSTTTTAANSPNSSPGYRGAGGCASTC